MNLVQIGDEKDKCNPFYAKRRPEILDLQMPPRLAEIVHGSDAMSDVKILFGFTLMVSGFLELLSEPELQSGAGNEAALL